MSTKCSIAYGSGFHFYHEVADDDHVYLELETNQFEAGYGRVMVPIPIHIWETIRHLGGADLSLVDKSDAELLSDVETEVDRRIATYEDARRTNPERAGIVSVLGGLVFGMADDPRGQQIEHGMEFYQRKRRHQQEIRAAIEQLREEQKA